MDKSIKKRRSYNTEIIRVLCTEFQVSEQFVRQCIRKEKHSITADIIRKKYHEMANATLQKIQEFKNAIYMNNRKKHREQ